MYKFPGSDYFNTGCAIYLLNLLSESMEKKKNKTKKKNIKLIPTLQFIITTVSLEFEPSKKPDVKSVTKIKLEKIIQKPTESEPSWRH